MSVNINVQTTFYWSNSMPSLPYLFLVNTVSQWRVIYMNEWITNTWCSPPPPPANPTPPPPPPPANPTPPPASGLLWGSKLTGRIIIVIVFRSGRYSPHLASFKCQWNMTRPQSIGKLGCMDLHCSPMPWSSSAVEPLWGQHPLQPSANPEKHEEMTEHQAGVIELPCHVMFCPVLPYSS